MAGRLPASVMMAAACLFGGGSIILFVARPLGSYVHLGWPLGAALGWDAGLSLLFFAQHSIMVRPFFRRRLSIPQHYWGAIYATASGVVFAAVAVFWQSTGDRLVEISEPYRSLMHALSILAVAVFVWGFFVLRGIDPLGVGALRTHLRDQRSKPAPFVVHGPYHWVRHPLYFAALVLIWCEGDVTADRLLFNVFWTLWIVAATHFEEADLVQEIGDDYRRYQACVPMLVPWRGPRKIHEEQLLAAANKR